MNVRLQREFLVRSSSYLGGSVLASLLVLSACTDTNSKTNDAHVAPSQSNASEAPTSGTQPSDTIVSSDTALTSDASLTSDTHSTGLPDATGLPDDTGQLEEYTCDPRQVTCRLQPPRCDFGFVPRVVDGCYTKCVRVDECVCNEADACPDRDQYTCNLSRQRCTPYLN